MTDTLGRFFAMLDDTEQAAFLNETGRTFRVVCQRNGSETMQFCRIAERLDADGKRFVRELAGYVDLYDRQP